MWLNKCDFFEGGGVILGLNITLARHVTNPAHCFRTYTYIGLKAASEVGLCRKATVLTMLYTAHAVVLT